MPTCSPSTVRIRLNSAFRLFLAALVSTSCSSLFWDDKPLATSDASAIDASASGIADAMPDAIDQFAATSSTLAAGFSHACSLRGDASVPWCWGINNFGQLGNGVVTSDGGSLPVAAVGVVGAKGLSLGQFHSCVVAADGDARCWGRNEFGELGDGKILLANPTPTLVRGLANVASIAVGDFHTCASVVSGAVYCWGKNQAGALGNGTVDDSAVPVRVIGIDDAVSVAAGEGFSCALSLEGKVRCWGENREGALGDGTTASKLLPSPVAGIDDASALAAGGARACVLRADTSAWCWGKDSAGIVSGTWAAAFTPAPVRGTSGARAISVGDLHACVLVGEEQLCWGRHAHGALGDGTWVDRSVAQRVSFRVGPELATGHFFSCTNSEGGVTCWGANDYGQLGNGGGDASVVPVGISLP